MRELAEKLRQISHVRDLHHGNKVVFFIENSVSSEQAAKVGKKLLFSVSQSRQGKDLRFSFPGKIETSEAILHIDYPNEGNRFRTRPMVTIDADEPEHLPRDWRERMTALVRRLTPVAMVKYK